MSDATPQPLGTFAARVTPPGSKSLTNRALVLSALADGESTLGNVLFADDTLVMLDGLARLGFHVRVDREAGTVAVAGRGGTIPAAGGELFCGNSGTTIRFLAAVCTLGRGSFALDGVPRMRQRPIGQLVDLLHNLGARIGYRGGAGFPPVEVVADGLPGGLLRFVSGQSSQFLSAVLQAAPYARNEVMVDLVGRQASWPYVAMTMRLMDQFGHTPWVVRDARGEPTQVIVPTGGYQATRYAVEPDASNASYFLAAAAVNPGSTVTVEGLGSESLQGDVGFAGLLERMGATVAVRRESITVSGARHLAPIDADLLHMPDMAQTLAVVACFADGPSTLRGLHTLRVKETDRVAALRNELTKLGAEVEVEGDAMTIHPPERGRLRPAAIDTYDDHRMAMSFAVAATRASGIRINDAECVNKTYPAFFADLERMRGANDA